ncbi:hypothetical protein [Paenibacillus ehimensis]|uniref:Uncharacterized protein n=1 Tax=Paenibacillus ehimensis TaxID=79264 RepID=A0ABT8VE29_9BACL|nr:hypothetical protein [Paenibacillus ehimensis]MDO3679234.1 hypothetical protein [Paenibacillus ehimensis]MEC0213794.1 hypothetical protein [Paenibacillus ehimensis]
MSFKKEWNHDKKKDKHTNVKVWQFSKASAGQGNAFAINASNVNIAKKKTIDVKKKVIIFKKKRHHR